MSSSTTIEELPESKLGTKQHWDDVYEREVNTFKDVGEEGEVWFGESSALKMSKWVRTHLPPNPSSASPTILDLGCGNGHFLFLLASAKGGYPGKLLTGVDYSQGSVDLARLIGVAKASGQGQEEESDESESEEEDGEGEERVGTEGEVRFEQGDVLVGEQFGGGEKWDLVTDKGTYDAISLSPHPLPPSNLPPSELYPQRITRLIKPGGFFLITSCNFTEEEIKLRFTKEGLGLTYHSRVNHPTFTFGGSKGSTVCTVAFRKDLA